jgi:hypothetical protein
MIALIPFAAIGAVAGLVSSVGGAVGSFASANKQRKLQKKAEAAAEKSMESARKALGVNYFEELAVQKEKFELQREATLTAQAGMMEGLQDAGARALAGGVGRLGLAGQKAQQETRTAMGKEMSDLQKMTAQEDSRLRDVGVQLDLAEAAGAQEAAAAADETRALQMQRGLESSTAAVQQGLSMVPLYQQNLGAQKQALAGMDLKAAGLTDFSKQIGDINSNRDLRQFKQSLTPQQQAQIFGSSQFTDAYQAADMSHMNPFQLRQ